MTKQQKTANLMDELLEQVAQMAEREEWWGTATDIRTIRSRIRRHMHPNDRASTSTVV